MCVCAERRKLFLHQLLKTEMGMQNTKRFMMKAQKVEISFWIDEESRTKPHEALVCNLEGLVVHTMKFYELPAHG